MRGTVKWYNVNKGYGFLVPEDGGGDVFIHYTALRKSKVTTLDEGQSVVFEVEPGRDGKPKAVKVELVRG